MIMKKFSIKVNGVAYEVEVEDLGGTLASPAPAAQAAAPAPQAAPTPAPAPAPAAAGGKTVVAPMPGTIVSMKVKVGDTVTKDTVVAILEAMKMENEIFAGVDGTVASVNTQGASVNTGDVIASIN